MTQYAFFFDESRCVDCRACAVACRDWNDNEVGCAKFLRRFTWEEGTFPELKMHTLFAPCYHCEEPACLKACPNGAIVKEDKYGAVLVDQERCEGCRSCWDACPYGAPRFADDSPKTKMNKCNMCIDRLEQGQMPVCANSCLTRALDFGPLSEMKGKYGEVQTLPGMPSPDTTKPSLVIKMAPAKRKVVPYDADKARHLFGQRGDKLDPLYIDVSALTDIKPGTVRKNKLDMKIQSAEEALEATRSDEW